MLSKRIIPCLDVKNGRVVKGVKFAGLRDAGDPVEVAKEYEQQGADEVVFLDITASYEKRDIMLEIVARTAESVFMPLTVGGGVRNIEDIRALLNAGADKVSINTAAVENSGLIKEASGRFGTQCIVAAIDAKLNRGEGRGERGEEKNWEVWIYGGRQGTGKDVIEWAREAERLGAGEILLTSMDRDGTEKGYDIELTKRVSETVGIPVIASGGVGNLSHLYEALTEGKADAVLAASIFHYGKFTVSEVKKYLKERGVEVRII